MDDADEDAEHIWFLVQQLNDLLHILDINLSIPIESPTDLTPSLLIAILESLLGTRIPLNEYAVAEAPWHKPETVESMNKVQNMKIFLGMLEHDVLGMDVGLSDVDPRSLARGEWNDIFYVAEILSWIGEQLQEAYRTPTEETVAMQNEAFMHKEDDHDVIGLGIYESSVDYAPPKLEDANARLVDASPATSPLLSELGLNTSFTLRVPSVCCGDCGVDSEPTICASLPPVHGELTDKEYLWTS
ncbi:hypothetical protein AX15_000799 [Amanita polypyramis BW_CC]|nr:hypothetical protein AX15_000799 [Amanita polypyramis BW_CC]